MTDNAHHHNPSNEFPEDMRKLVEIHIVEARSKACRIFAFASAVYPKEWQNTYLNEFMPDILEFCYHARRVNQLCGFEKHEFGKIDTLLVNIETGDPGSWEKNYKFALDKMIHMTEFVFGSASAEHRRIFLASESNLIPLYLKVKTDKKETCHISIFGLVDCFLNRVIPAVRLKFTHLIY